MPTKAAKKKATPSTPPNAFIGRTTKPRDVDVAAALGGAKPLWDQVVAELEREHGLKPEWNSFSPKYGWSLRMKRKDRNIVYLGAYSGGFAAMLILGGKALQAARKNLPSGVFADAKKYPEGTAVRVEMKTEGDLEIVKPLVLAKLG